MRLIRKKPAAHADLYLTIGGIGLAPAFVNGALSAFRLLLPAHGIRLRSQSFRPNERDGSHDTRTLGRVVTRLQILQDDRTVDFPLDLPVLNDGFYPLEDGAWRWTDGDAGLPDALFAGLRGPAVLLVTSHGPEAGSAAALGPAIYLAGDSYPQDAYVETNLFGALHPLFAGTGGHLHERAPIGVNGRPESRIETRLRPLRRRLRELSDPSRIVLIGRSSGARVITQLACRERVAAVICLGYPFRAPGVPAEPQRFRHLAKIKTPVLIFQGRHDSYGGTGVASAYPLSPAVRLHFVDAQHELHLTPAEWLRVARRIILFLAETAR